MEYHDVLPVPDLFQARSVICVQPHYDDNDIGAGGTIAALRAHGATITYLTAANDLAGVVDPALCAEAAILQAMPRLASDPEVDRQYQPYALQGIGFYFTPARNTIVDIAEYRETKHAALAAYRSQLPPEDLQSLLFLLDLKQHEWGATRWLAAAEAPSCFGRGSCTATWMRSGPRAVICLRRFDTCTGVC